MEKHHGKIWFESDTNKGTTFLSACPAGYNIPISLPQQASVPMS
jgi:two-component system sensor histidine kinase VicK